MPSNLPPVWEVPEASKRNPYTILAQALESFPKYWMQMKMYTDAQEHQKLLAERKIELTQQQVDDNNFWNRINHDLKIWQTEYPFSSGSAPPEWENYNKAFRNDVMSSPEYKLATPETQESGMKVVEEKIKQNTTASQFYAVERDINNLLNNPTEWYGEGMDFPAVLQSHLNKLDPSIEKMKLESGKVSKGLKDYYKKTQAKQDFDSLIKWQGELYGIPSKEIQRYIDTSPENLDNTLLQWRSYFSNYSSFKKLTTDKIEKEHTTQKKLMEDLSSTTSDNPYHIDRWSTVDRELAMYNDNPDAPYLHRAINPELYWERDAKGGKVGEEITIGKKPNEWKQIRYSEIQAQDINIAQMKDEFLRSEMSLHRVKYPEEIIKSEELFKTPPDVEEPLKDVPVEILKQAFLNVGEAMPDMTNPDGTLKDDYKDKGQAFNIHKAKIDEEIKRLMEEIPADTTVVDTTTEVPADTEVDSAFTIPADTITVEVPESTVPLPSIEESDTSTFKKPSVSVIKGIDRQLGKLKKSIDDLEGRLTKKISDRDRKRLQSQLARFRKRRDLLLAKRTGEPTGLRKKAFTPQSPKEQQDIIIPDWMQ